MRGPGGGCPSRREIRAWLATARALQWQALKLWVREFLSFIRKGG